VNARIGYKASAKQFAPRELVESSVEAECRGLEVSYDRDFAYRACHNATLVSTGAGA
jgi:hypothetical protein